MNTMSKIWINRNSSRVAAGLRACVLALFIGALPSLPAYQVWTSTCKTPKTVLEHPEQWSVVAAGVQGLNCNFAPGSVNKPSGEQWKQILARYTVAHTSTYGPWARSGGAITDTVISNHVSGVMRRAEAWGYTIHYLMLYDHRADKGGINKWTDDDVRRLRAWLDGHGYASIKLMYNARSFGSKDLLLNPAIAAALNEGNTTYWRENKAGRRDLLKWFVTNPATKDKEFFFQITEHHDFQADPFVATRLMIRSISADILGSTDWVRTDKVIFLPMTYQDYPTNFPFLPQYAPTGNDYGQSMSGLLGSLIEQKDLFEGRGADGLISVAQCNSYSRTALPAADAGK